MFFNLNPSKPLIISDVIISIRWQVPHKFCSLSLSNYVMSLVISSVRKRSFFYVSRVNLFVRKSNFSSRYVSYSTLTVLSQEVLMKKKSLKFIQSHTSLFHPCGILSKFKAHMSPMYISFKKH